MEQRADTVAPRKALLAVDLGLKTGLALYGADGRLTWYRSQNYGSADRLRRAVHGLLKQAPDIRALVIEGGGNLAAIWEKEAQLQGIAVCKVGAEVWRQVFLFPREQRSGEDAKRHAGDLARKVIEWSGATRPTSLRHDAAEAILIGLWGVLHLGWLPSIPKQIQR